MKHIIYTILTLSLLAFVGCERRKTIPDKELAAIFHDAMIVNAYIGNSAINTDSLNIYEPIFERYGYTTEDVRYTMSSFLRRKSANLSDVVNDMIEAIETEYYDLKLQVTKLDTIESVALRSARRIFVQDTMQVVKKAADTVKLHYTIPVEDMGEYKIVAHYSIDEKDKSRGRRFSVKKMMRDSSLVQAHSSLMQRTMGAKSTATINIQEKDSNVIALVINFDDFSQATKSQQRETPRPKVSKMTLEEVTVTMTPPLERAIEQLYERQLGIHIFADTMFFNIANKAATEQAELAEEEQEIEPTTQTTTESE